MTAEALGVSVAPSFFHTCVSEGKVARPEEVQKFKVLLSIYFILCPINTCAHNSFTISLRIVRFFSNKSARFMITSTIKLFYLIVF